MPKMTHQPLNFMNNQMYDQLGRTRKLLPICADCIERAPADQQFSTLGIAAQGGGILWGITKCCVCKSIQRCAYVAPLNNDEGVVKKGTP